MADYDITYKLTNIKPPFRDSELELNVGSISNFYFIENVENMFLTGRIDIEDLGGLFESLPLTGEESLRVDISQDIEGDNNVMFNATKTLDFDFFKIEVLPIEKVTKTTYRLHLVESGFYDFIGKEYSKSYSNKKASEIVIDVLKNQLAITDINRYDVEESEDKLNFIIPYWKPLVTLKYLAKLARRKPLPHEGGYLFYSTSNGKDTKFPIKKFVSFSNLLEKKVEKESHQVYSFKKDNAFNINNILESKNPYHSNRGSIKNGISGKKSYSVNLLTDKSIDTSSRTYTDFITKSKTIGNVSYLSLGLDEVDSEVTFIGEHDTNIVKNYQNHKFRMLIEGYNKKDVVLEGLLNRYCGKLIYIEQASSNANEAYEKHDSGTWFIKGVTHFFAGGEYTQKMTILKDGYDETRLTGHQNIKS